MSHHDDLILRLQEGNRRFAAGKGQVAGFDQSEVRTRLAEGQAPFAVILGCSDSRVPAEVVFDQGLGDLFVVRVAGNVAAPSQIASVEYAARHLGSSLVVVLGHSGCGAVAATLDDLDSEPTERDDHLKSIMDRIRPALSGLDLADPDHQERAVRANIRQSVDQLRTRSTVLSSLCSDGVIKVAGAQYCLNSGLVEFLD